MKKFLAYALLLLTASPLAFSASPPGQPLPKVVETRLNTSATDGPAVKLGSIVTQKKIQVMKAVYDVRVMGGISGTTATLRDAAGGYAVLPAGAVVRNGFLNTITTFTSTNAQFTFKVGSQSIKSNTAVTNFVSTAGSNLVTLTALDGTLANAFRTTASSDVTVTNAGGTVTAGKIYVFLEYFLAD